eukprot:11904512-Alexandrium_andersonii.AAC.1
MLPPCRTSGRGGPRQRYMLQRGFGHLPAPIDVLTGEVMRNGPCAGVCLLQACLEQPFFGS